MLRTVCLLAFGVTATFSIVVGCSSTKDDGDAGSTGGIDEAGTIQLADNACKAIAPVHRKPECDGCTRALCCETVIECDRSDDCKALVACLVLCKPEDSTCPRNCGAAHNQGARLIAPVDMCAGLKCPIPCETAFIGDGGPD